MRSPASHLLVLACVLTVGPAGLAQEAAPASPATRPAAEEPVPPQRDLELVTGEKVTGPLPPGARYIVYFQTVQLLRPSPTLADLSQTQAWQDMSPGQKGLLTHLDQVLSELANRTGGAHWILPGLMTSRYTHTYLTYAASPEDAELLVQAILAATDRKALAERRKFEQRLAEVRQGISRLQESIPQWRQELESVTEYQQRVSADLTFMEDPPPIEETRRLVLEYGRASKLLDVDIAGMRARIEAIRKAMDKPSPDNGRKLVDALTEQQIELDGTLARQNMTAGLLKLAQTLYKAQTRAAQLQRQIDQQTAQLQSWQQQLPNLEIAEAAPPEQMQTVDVVDNKVWLVPEMEAGPGGAPRPAPDR